MKMTQPKREKRSPGGKLGLSLEGSRDRHLAEDICATSNVSRRALIALSVGGALFIGSWTSSHAQTPQYGGVLNVGIGDDTKSLDPIFQIGFSERQPEYLIYNTLFGLAADFSVIPELAQSWSASDDGLNLILHLRGGIKFQDGTDFDAEAVKWNLDRRLSDKVNSPSQTVLGPIISAVDVVDPLTVRIRLKTPSRSLLGMLAQREGFMVSPTAAKKYGESFGLHPVGTGPFIFKKWLQNDRIVLEKNPNYWEKGKPYLDGVVFHQLSAPIVGVPRVLTGELDVLSYLSPNEARLLEGKSAVKLVLNPGARWVSLHMDENHPPFNDVRVRKAIAYGLDRKKIMEITTAGKGTVANGPTPPHLWWFDKNLPQYPHNPEKAKKLLAEAGYGNGCSLTLSTPPDALYRPISILVQAQLKKIGIDVTIEPVSQTMWAAMAMNEQIHFFPITWTQRPDPDGLMTLLLDSASSQNWVHFHNAEFDRLLKLGRLEKDRNRRRKIYDEAQEILGEQLPYVNLFFGVEYTALRRSVHNFAFIPDDIPRFREVWKSE